MVASASWGENDRRDATLRYAGQFGGFRLADGCRADKNPLLVDSASGQLIGVDPIADARGHETSGLLVSASAAGQRISELTAGGDLSA